MNKIQIHDLGKIITGKTPRTSNSQNYGGNIPFLTPSDNLSQKYIRSTKKTLTQIGVDAVKSSLLPPNSICVSCIGSDLGKVVIAPQYTVTNQQINSIVLNESLYDLNYIYYKMILVGRELNYISKTSTAVPIVNKSSFGAYQISIPSLEEQKRVGLILSALDDKIELNRKMNENLEQQAAALFKHWFIDFEFPDAKGKPYRSSGGKMKDSPLGLIPEEWECSLLAQVATVVGGGTPSKAKEEYYCEDGIAWITPKDLSLNKNKFISKGSVDVSALGYSKSGAKLIPTGSILFSSRAPIGYIAIAMNDICTNQGFKSVVPSSPHGTAFLYYYLKNNVKLIESKSTGSTFKEASGALMKSLDIIAPPSDLLSNFEKYCTSLFDMQLVLENEINKLSTLRNSLLVQLFNPNL